MAFLMSRGIDRLCLLTTYGLIASREQQLGDASTSIVALLLS